MAEAPLASSLVFLMNWGYESNLALCTQASARQLQESILFSHFLGWLTAFLLINTLRMSWRDGPVGKDACRQDLLPEFDPLEPHRRTDSCLLPSDLHMQMMVCTLTHTQLCVVKLFQILQKGTESM